MTGENPPKVAPPSAPSSAHKFYGRLDPATSLGDFWLPDGRQIQEQFNTQDEFLNRWEELTGQRVTTNADSKGFKLFAEVPAETAPPTPEDLARFTKKPASANRPAHPSDATENESDGNNPPPDGSDNSPAHSPEAGQMPVIDGIQWESKFNRGNFTGVEAWHSPTGARNRAGKTYLGKLGKRQLAAWSKLPPDEFRQAAIAWIELKRLAKGIA